MGHSQKGLWALSTPHFSPLGECPGSQCGRSPEGAASLGRLEFSDPPQLIKASCMWVWRVYQVPTSQQTPCSSASCIPTWMVMTVKSRGTGGVPPSLKSVMTSLGKQDPHGTNKCAHLNYMMEYRLIVLEGFRKKKWARNQGGFCVYAHWALRWDAEHLDTWEEHPKKHPKKENLTQNDSYSVEFHCFRQSSLKSTGLRKHGPTSSLPKHRHTRSLPTTPFPHGWKARSMMGL